MLAHNSSIVLHGAKHSLLGWGSRLAEGRKPTIWQHLLEKVDFGVVFRIFLIHMATYENRDGFQKVGRVETLQIHVLNVSRTRFLDEFSMWLASPGPPGGEK